MEKFNQPFFGLYESMFRVYSKEHGKEQAINFMKSLFSFALGKAYDQMGFVKGSPQDFVRVVKERDNGVGLPVELPLISENKIIYEFHQDPFPGLKDLLTYTEIDYTYLDFKVTYLLGSNWSYKTTKHIWLGDSFSQHIIEKKAK